MGMKVTLIDEYGEHEYETDGNIICITDDGKGNVTFTEEECEE